jgi:parallel beta-helix repeat protein
MMKKLVFGLICLLPVYSSQAITITVGHNGTADFDNIQAAINSSGQGDTIVVRPGIYSGSIFFNNKPVTLTSENPDDPDVVQSTVIAGSSAYSVNFDFGEGRNSVITGFTITGRGIHCYGASPTISKNIIRDCSGHGIYGENKAAPLISGNTISANVGYGIYYCDGPIEDNTISQNKGGIAYCNGPITGNRITNNSDTSTSSSGAALLFCKGPITRNLLEDNYAANRGGACYECSGAIAGNRIIGNRSVISGGALSNCRGRISHNIIAGNRSANGAGLFSCYLIHNNTIVGNIAEENGGAMSQCPGYISNNIIAFNSASFVGGIYGAGTSSYNDFYSNEGGNLGGGVSTGPGDIIAEPLLVSSGYWDSNGTVDRSDDFWVDGDYHVTSQAGRWNPDLNRWVNDSLTSPCIDAGGLPGDPNSNWTGELWPHGRRINIGAYGGTPEASMSLSDVGNIADLNPDVSDVNDWVDYEDMLLLTGKWLSNETPVAEDLNRDGVVDFRDYAILLNNWQPKIQPPMPPEPDPMTWAIEPQATSKTAIAMTAIVATSTDHSDVEYYFKSNSPGGHDSGWQAEPNYTDTGLAAGTQYSYMVKARNTGNLMETAYSNPRVATTFPADTTAPSPNPAAWKTAPYRYSASSVRMVAATASDESGVEYYFACTSNPAYSSGWQDSPEYLLTSLPKGLYSFVTRARDKSPNHNTTGNSVEVTVDLQPPQPDPLTWESEPAEISHGGGRWDYWAEMTASEASDASGGVQYYFECTTTSEFSSGWQSSRTYSVQIGRSGQYQFFRVKARDIYGNQTAPSSELPALLPGN